MTSPVLPSPAPAAADVLAALRPLHLPPPPSWWPPAPGWWLLAAGGLLALGGVFLWRHRRRRHRGNRRSDLSAQRVALQTLAALEGRSEMPASHRAAAVNTLLKRYALVCWPRSDVAALNGTAWLHFLDSHGGDGAFAEGPGRCLAALPYRREETASSPELPDALWPLARRWIQANAPQRPKDKHNG